MNETELRKRIQLELSHGPCRLFRNNVGQAWLGRSVMRHDGSVIIHAPQRVSYGLAVGSGDLIGWRALKITPEMVGATIAQFVSLEVKVGAGRYGAGQKEWADAVTVAGGVGAFVNSVESAYMVLHDPK
jgi:hypothetical protein